MCPRNVAGERHLFRLGRHSLHTVPAIFVVHGPVLLSLPFLYPSRSVALPTPSSPPSLLERLRVIGPGLRKYWPYVALAVVMSMVTAAFEGLSIGMLIPFLQTLSSDAGSFTTGVYWIDVYLLGSESTTLGRMYRICGVILAATWLRGLTGYLTTVFTTISRSRIVQNLRERIIDQLVNVAFSFYAREKHADLLHNVTTEVGRAAATLGVLFAFITDSMMLVMYASIMIFISWELSLVAFGIFLILGVGLTGLINSIRETGQEITDSGKNFTGLMTEFLAGVRTVAAYNTQDFERNRLHSGAKRSSDAVIETTKRKGILQPLSQALISTIIIIMVVWAVQSFVLAGDLSIAFVLTFLFALFRMTPIINRLNSQRGTLAETQAGLESVAAILDTADKPYLSEGNRLAPPLRDAIRLKNVDFSYVDNEPVLKDITLPIEYGKTTALVGASGAGKSTLADLIPRFHDPTGGRITYDGIDLREFKVHSLRERIAIVSQDTHIFNDTVSANIAYGAPDTPFEEIRSVAEQANALEFIEDLENGFDTILGERGVRLSGGQRQRIAIARAILEDPEILILDEATSSLDSISEKLVQQSLEHLMDDRTVIAIAHRLSTIEDADWVVVLEDGEIVEQGPYGVLIEQRGQLWEYHAVQYQMA